MTSVKTRYNTIIRVIQTVQLEPRLAARVKVYLYRVKSCVV